jgi:predicted metal-dependent peptidase
MPRKRPKQRQSTRREKVEAQRAAAWEGRRLLSRGPLAPLVDAVAIREAEGGGAPRRAAVDPEAACLWLSLDPDHPLGEGEWASVIGHLLLHLGFNHAARREERSPLLWNVACDIFVANFLSFFGLRDFHRSHGIDREFENKREEEIYEALVESGALRSKREYITLAGGNKPDILGLERIHLWRRDYENLLGEGIRRAMEAAITEVAEQLSEQAITSKRSGPAERARRWVMNEFPLLGALATQVRIIADAALCDRMDISIAAVDGFLGEMYVHPGWNFTQEEMVFVYVHELLHVALLHHTRSGGRDPWLWNIACDFVINGWLIEMGVGRMPAVGGLYDPNLQGMSAEEVYDLLARDTRRCRGMRGFRGKLGGVLLDSPGRRIYRGDVTTLDDIYRRCMAVGLSCMGRGTVPAGLLEEIRALFTPPVPWDVELGRWMEQHVPIVRDKLRTYARASRRQSSTPDIPRPARYVPQEWRDACTFGVVLDTSGSMDRELLGRALGAIASYAEAREVPAVRLVLCDAAPYDQGFVAPTDLRGIYPIRGRGGTVLQPAANYLLTRPDFPAAAPVMIITDGWCEEEILVPREHCFILPRKSWKEGAISLRTSAPIFRVLREERFED